MSKIEEAIEFLTQRHIENTENAEGSIESELADILMQAKKELEREYNQLEAKKKCFEYEMDIRQRSLETNENLFKMKWQVLEKEIVRVAEESKKIEKKKAFYDCVESTLKEDVREDNVVHGELFFKGVYSPQGLRKRYKDLIKIYHPDSEFGDIRTVQEINREYANLKHAMAK